MSFFLSLAQDFSGTVLRMLRHVPDCSQALAGEMSSAGIIQEPSSFLPARALAFLELCCDHDSAFGGLGPRFGYACMRITKGCKFHTRRGLDMALGLLDAHPGAEVCASLPCTPWTTWTHLNEVKLGAKYRAKVAWQRRQSLRMVSNATLCMKKAVQAGGGGHFEWPRRARGWRRRRVMTVIRELRMVLAHFDGCCFGVRAGPDTLARKPWTAATTSAALALVLRGFLCAGGHARGALSGRWATQSGHYPDRLCRLVLQTLSASFPSPPTAVRPLRRGLWTYSRVALLRGRVCKNAITMPPAAGLPVLHPRPLRAHGLQVNGSVADNVSAADGSLEINDLLNSLAAAVFEDQGDLGAVARSLRDAAPRPARQRDIFTLPLATCSSEFAKAIVAVLNFLKGCVRPWRSLGVPQRRNARC